MNFTVPTIFTAIDAMQAPMRAMQNHVNSFAASTTNAIQKSNAVWKRFVPSLGDAQKQLLSMVGSAALIGVVFSGISFSTNSIIEYEKTLASLQTVTGLTTQEFEPFKNQVQSVARATKASSIDVAKSFELIASANADLLKFPDQLAAVSQAAITLSKASNMTIESSAGSLTNAMNQFGVGADKANDFINIFVQSQAAGTASIQSLADSMVVAGGTARAFGLDFEKTNVLLQGFAKGGKVGSEAGTQLSGILSKLSKVTNKDFNPVHTDAIKVIDNLAKANLSYTQLMKLTDAEGAKWLSTIINQNAVVQELNGTLNVANAAQAAAQTNTATFSDAVKDLSNAWVNMITASDKASSTIQIAGSVLRFVANHLETLVAITATYIGVMVAWKAIIIGVTAVKWALATAEAVNLALQGKTLLFLQGNNVAMAAYKVITFAVTAAQWAWNIAMSANPIALIIIGIAALIAVIALVIYKWNEWGAAATVVFAIFMPGLMLIINLVQSFRRNWDMITEAFSKGGILAGLKAIGATLLDAVLMPLKQLLDIIAKIDPTGVAAKASAGLEQFRKGLGVNVTTDESGNYKQDPTPLLNPQLAREDRMTKAVTEQIQRNKLDINIKDKTKDSKVDWSGSLLPNVNLSSTR